MAKQTFTTGQVLTAAQMTSLQQTAMGGGSTTAKTVSYTLVAADAGTVIQMNSASATTITVNTSLFAAGDTVQIQNIGAGVCTVTAGTATVNTAGSLALSQYEGGQLYFNTTSAAFFFDVVQASSSSGMTLINTTTFTSSSAISVDSLFSATYTNYRLLLAITASSGAADIRMKLRSGGADNSSNDYITQASQMQAAVLSSLNGTTTTGWFVLVNSDGAACLAVDIFNPFTATIAKTAVSSGFGGANERYSFGGYRKNNATQFTGVSFLLSANNCTGTLSTYGMAM